MPTRRTFVVLAAAAAALIAAPAFAVGNLVDVQVVARARGDTLPVYADRGMSWIAGRPGDRYALRLTNRSPGRVLVVLSVDGVNAVSGETAAVDQIGYVLAPWQTTEITGWRKSLSEAAAFYFTALPDSYAARTDRPDNVGVVGVAVFREREPVVMMRPLSPPAAESRAAESESSRDRAAGGAGGGGALAQAAPSAKSAAPSRDERLGTGHGEREYAPTTQTTFERASERPVEIVRLRYDSVENLLASGVIPRPWRRPAGPEPFPGFVPDPRG